MRRRLKKSKFARELIIWPVFLSIAFVSLWLAFGKSSLVSATVTNSGVVFFGDNSATGQGNIRVRTFTDPATWGSQFDGATASGTQYINYVVAKAAPTREEVMIGALKYNGTLDIQTCTTGCDANGDFTARWNNPGTNATLTCNTTTGFGCDHPFDIAYEGLSGNAFVAYADNVAAKIYYARWDGSSWSPNATPGSPGASNELNTNPGGGGAACSGTPKYIRAIPAGGNLGSERSNRIMVLVGDSNSDVCAFYWDGSSFDTGKTVTATLANEDKGQSFDGAWQSNSKFIMNYSTSGLSEVDYITYTVGTGWNTGAQAYTTGAIPIFLTTVSDPTSTRVLSTVHASTAYTRSAVWRGDNSTDGWTACNTGGSTNPCPDTTTEDAGGNDAYVAFERFNGDGLHVYNNAGTTADPSYWAYTASSTWSTDSARNSITTTDDSLMTKAWGSPNSDHIMNIVEDLDCKIYGNTWTGSGWDATATNLNNGTTATVSNYETASVPSCPNSLNPAAAPTGAGYAYDFVFKPYSPWQRNWRFYDGADTNNTPTTALANENTEPTGFGTSAGARLRINYSERGNALNNSDARKKLQYVSGCNPNSVLETTCTWTDVGQSGSGSIWRYKQVSTFTDNTLLAGTTLTGTNGTCTAGNGCGTFVVDGTSAAGANMDHNAGITQESEWDIESNGAANSTTYYFRIWDNQQATPIYRTQYASDCGAGSATCTYPSITTVAAAGPTTDQLLRGGNYFSGGAEQSFYWAQSIFLPSAVRNLRRSLGRLIGRR